MQLEIPNNILENLLAESATFRAFIVDQMSSAFPRNDAFRERLILFKERLTQLSKSNKIMAIKDVRGMRGEEREFVNIIAAEKRIYLSPNMGLAEAKNFIESL